MKDQIAIITGGGRGIGAATGRLLAERGARVALVSRTLKELEDTMRQIQAELPTAEVEIIAADVADERAVLSAFDQVEKRFGSPATLLVNAAGWVEVVPFADIRLETWERTFAINVRGAFLCGREFFRRRKKAGPGGVVVNISSLAGIRGTEKFPGLSAYTSAKHAVVGLTEAMAVEGRPLGIRVNCVAPGAVNTAMLKKAAPSLRAQAEPEDLARVIAYLCDPKEARVVTGSIMEVHTNA